MANSKGMGLADPVALIRDMRRLADRAGGIGKFKEFVGLLAE